MSMKKKVEEVMTVTQKLSKTNLHLTGPFMMFIRRVEEKGHLDAKTKEIMLVALSVALNCEWCIAYHTKMALDCGATPDELIEACMVATLIAGTPAMMNTQLVYQTIEEFKK